MIKSFASEDMRDDYNVGDNWGTGNFISRFRISGITSVKGGFEIGAKEKPPKTINH